MKSNTITVSITIENIEKSCKACKFFLITSFNCPKDNQIRFEWYDYGDSVIMV